MFTAKSSTLKVTQLNHNKYRVSDRQNSIIVEKKPYNLTIRFGPYTIQQEEDGFDVFITTPWTQVGSYEFSDTNAQFYQTVNPRSSHALQFSMPIQKKILPIQTTQNPALYVQANNFNYTTNSEENNTTDNIVNGVHDGTTPLGAYVNLLCDNNKHINSANYINSTDDWDDKKLTIYDNFDGTTQNYYTTTAIKSNQNIYDGCATETVPQIYSPFDYYRYSVPVDGENNIQQNAYKQIRQNSLNIQAEVPVNDLQSLLHQ